MRKAKLVLEDGAVWTGIGFGYGSDAVGEVAFTTLMGGTVEQLADPRCAGHLLAHTFPMLGNYGVPKGIDRAYPAGIIAREVCINPSNHMCAHSLDEFLAEKKVPGLAGVDTRHMMRHLRSTGPQKGIITDADISVHEAQNRIKAYNEAVPAAETEPARTVSGKGYSVAVVDLGAALPLANALSERHGLCVKVWKGQITADKILAEKPDGIIIGDGSGSPDRYAYITAEIRAMSMSGTPLMACGLGCLLLAEAMGGSIRPMKRPHRGGNQPVREERTGRLLITYQYHGYEIDSLPKGAVATYTNLHGDSVEGFRLAGIPVEGIQFDLAEQDGPHDPTAIIKEFIHKIAEVAKVCP